jgi:DNA-binding transcriptional ArsR family regulator
MIKHPDYLDTTAKQGGDYTEIKAALPSDEEMQEIARTFQALADRTRSKIIWLLTSYELCVNEIAEVLGVSASGVSHHLKGLRDIRLVKFRREGNQIYYTVDDAHVAALFHEAVNHLDHVRRNLPDHRLEPAQRLAGTLEADQEFVEITE